MPSHAKDFQKRQCGNDEGADGPYNGNPSSQWSASGGNKYSVPFKQHFGAVD